MNHVRSNSRWDSKHAIFVSNSTVLSAIMPFMNCKRKHAAAHKPCQVYSILKYEHVCSGGG